LVKLPVCFESKSTAAIFRKLLDELGYQYQRKSINRSYTRVAIVIALERTALVHRYEIEDNNIIVDIWEEIPNSGRVTYLEIKGGEDDEMKILLKKFSEKLPRKPWEYTLGQKIRNGWFSQGIYGAKKSWNKMIQ
jgi:CRISPR/Cas system-associated protein endoribonuclease Cas2